MNELKVFENEEFGSVRTVDIDGKIYFMANDVAKALGYLDCPKAIRTHCKVVAEIATPTAGGMQNVKFIPEGDIYRLIIRSKLQSAERFEKWVFDEVIPSIHKHGAYFAGQESMSNEELFARAILAADKMIAERDEIIASQNEKIEEQKPLVDFAVHVSMSKDTIDMEEMAKIARDENIDIGMNRLFEWLRKKRILTKNNTPYQEYINRGYFDMIEVKKETAYGAKVFPKVVITGKGQMWIAEKLRMEYPK